MRSRNSSGRAGRRVRVMVCATVFALGAVAAAAAADRAPSLAFSYSRASLSSERGVATLYERIVRAARAVCPAYLHGDLTAQAEEHLVLQCRRKAVEDAVRRINDPRLSAMEALRKGRR